MKLQIQQKFPLPVAYEKLDKAVERFVEESDEFSVPYDHAGLYQQTIETIGGILHGLAPTRWFWLAVDSHRDVAAYALTHISKDVDNAVCYWGTQAYVAPQYRRTKFVKECWDTLQQHARDLGCRHFIIPSSRETKAYCRFLGEGWHTYVTLLKKDL